jgi:hypothetical protein
MQEMRNRQECSQQALMSVLSELAHEKPTGPEDNFTQTAMDVFVESGGNESQFENAIHNSADLVAAKVEVACKATAMYDHVHFAGDGSVPINVDIALHQCEMDACTAFHNIEKISTAASRRRLAAGHDDVPAPDCAIRAGLGQARRMALHNDSVAIATPAPIPPYLAPFTQQMEEIAANKNVTTVDVPDSIMAIKIEISRDLLQSLKALLFQLKDGRIQLEGVDNVEGVEARFTQAGVDIGVLVNSAKSCTLGQEQLSAGLSGITIYASCPYATVALAEAGVATAGKKSKELVAAMEKMMGITAVSRRLGGASTTQNSRSLAADTIIVKTTSTQMNKNCQVGKPCPSSTVGLSAVIIALIIIGCLVVIAIVIAVVVIKKKKKNLKNKTEVAEVYEMNSKKVAEPVVVNAYATPVTSEQVNI